jgi:effector-binding domain-containing protein
MLSDPKIVERIAQPYACVRRTIGMNDITKVADKMSGEFFAWLGQRGIAPAGAPFFKYNSFDGDGKMELEWGAPVPADTKGDDLVKAGTLPAGRYVSAMHTGPFGGLREATGKVLTWVEDNDLELDRRITGSGESFGCRLEIYFTDPRAEPDSRKWQTEITMRLADEA